MPTSDAAMQKVASYAQTVMALMLLHSDDPGDGTQNRIGIALPIPWGPVFGHGSWGMAESLMFDGLPSKSPVNFASIWSADRATCYGVYDIVGNKSASPQGLYEVTAADFLGVAEDVMLFVGPADRHG